MTRKKLFLLSVIPASLAATAALIWHFYFKETHLRKLYDACCAYMYVRYTTPSCINVKIVNAAPEARKPPQHEKFPFSVRIENNCESQIFVDTLKYAGNDWTWRTDDPSPLLPLTSGEIGQNNPVIFKYDSFGKLCSEYKLVASSVCKSFPIPSNHYLEIEPGVDLSIRMLAELEQAHFFAKEFHLQIHGPVGPFQ